MSYHLQIENLPTITDPMDQQIVQAANSLTPDGGPGFLVLESGGNDYVQTAGGNGEYVLEWREYYGEVFAHYVAGRGAPAIEEHEVRTNGFVVNVRKSEVLDLVTVKSVLLAFRHMGERPTDLFWRDNTGMFK